MLLETLIFLICLAKTFLCLVFLKGIIAFAFSTFMGIFSIYIIASY
ncbi:hypothetical protein BFJ68_g16202 [Fusarium oxysporum]|uniref:Uncharacterized protein n=1 Tax=Fusarium oxysporum TaxID=5507 RepID=A0A420PFZ3_FUSOX|nr:hypothetical protein FOMA001_g13588 [Fusarium oxysporum f. sp. matthiolae]RKK91422.1 hypothetical protein BFJ68_g16202 [Fusarium oxysporum]